MRRNIYFGVVALCLAVFPVSEGLAQKVCMDYWTAAYKCMQGCGSCGGGDRGGGQVYTPGPSPEEQRRMRDQKDLREAADHAYDKGVEAYDKGNWEQAVNYFKESLEHDPDNPDTRTNLNQALRRLQEARAAEEARQRQQEIERQAKSSSSSGQSRQVTAWKQLHCAASIAAHALSALQTKGDYDEFGTLSTEALKALDGQRPGVECGNAPPFSDLRGTTVDMDRVKGTERQILERAAAIADRMKQRQVSPRPSQAAIPAGPETPDERLRRVQRELNVINSRPTGRTQSEIYQQEKDRRDLARLVLVNNGLVNGELTSVSVDTREETSSRPRRRREPPPPPSTTP